MRIRPKMSQKPWHREDSPVWQHYAVVTYPTGPPATPGVPIWEARDRARAVESRGSTQLMASIPLARQLGHLRPAEVVIQGLRLLALLARVFSRRQSLSWTSRIPKSHSGDMAPEALLSSRHSGAYRRGRYRFSAELHEIARRTSKHFDRICPVQLTRSAWMPDVGSPDSSLLVSCIIRDQAS